LEERQRLARDLHDSVIQMIYSLNLLAEAGRLQAERGNIEEAALNLAEIGETAVQALKEMRLLVYQLRQPALEQLGLVEALRQRLARVEQRAGVAYEIVAGELPALLPAQEEALFRIAQEALNNALKHAAASRVSVHLAAQDGRLLLGVADNGKGFESGLSAGGGLGLTSIRERIEKLNGGLEIRSRPGAGTQILAWLPTNEAEDLPGSKEEC
jgi:signal transduction histidine kinase